MQILGIIPARGGSKSIPRKNIKVLGKKPLIVYTIETAKKSELITHLIVSTDDKEIAKIAKEWGADVPFLRPKELAGDRINCLPVMQHALQFMEEKLNLKFDYAVLLLPTSPFRTREDIDETIQLLIDTGAESAVSLVKMEGGFHPVKAKKLKGQRVLPYYIEEPEGIMRQDLPPAHKMSGDVFVKTRELLMEKNRLHGDNIVGHVIPKERSVNINDEFDWLKAEYMLKRLRKKGYDL